MTSAKLFTIAIAGGLLLSSALGLADDNKKAPPPPPAAPAPSVTVVPPLPPAPHPGVPMPPMPPMPSIGSGFSVNIHDGKVEIAGVKGLVDQQLDIALAKVAAEKNLPPEVREKLMKRLTKMRDKLGKKLDKLDVTDMDQLGEQLGDMGEEISQEMEGFSDEMEKWGEQYGKDFSKDFNAKNFKFKWGKDPHGKINGHLHVKADDDDDDSADDDADVSVPDLSDDDDDIKDAIKDLGDLALKPGQRDAIGKLRTDSDKQVATAKKELDRQSDALKGLLANPNASDADVARAVDAVSSQEAAIRKARLLAWVDARRMLDAGQRAKVEATAGKPPAPPKPPAAPAAPKTK